MTGFLRPVGPQPAQVYWVRRLVVLAAAVLLVVLAVLAVGALRGSAAAPVDPAAQGGTTAPGGDAAPADTSPDQAQTPADGAPVACAPAALTVTLTAEARSFVAPAAPTFALAVTNTGEVPCTLDAGSGNEVVTVTSGSDRIWSSSDCAGEVAERLLLLQPGAQDVVPVAWDRTRSDAACTADLPTPGAGTYQAVGTVLGAQSAPFVFELG